MQALVLLFAVISADVEFQAGVYPVYQEFKKPAPAFRETFPSDLTRVGCELRIDFSDTGNEMFSPGSGVNTDYGVLTCWHCVKGHQFEVECDGEIARGVVIAKDESADVALISVQWKRQHPTVGISAVAASGIMQSVARSAEGSIAVEERKLIGRDSTGTKLLVSPAFFASQSGGGLIDQNGQLTGIISGNVIDRKPFRGLVIPAEAIRRILPANAVRQAAGSAESAPTPYAEIERVLSLLPKPSKGFVDFGCGADARWCLAAAEKWGCKCIGMEIDPTRAKLAQERVKAEGFADLIEIYYADSTAYSYPNCDVGIAYLYPATLDKLKPQIEGLTAFASMFHQPPVPAIKNGNAWIYRKPAMTAMASQPVGIWNGVAYSGPQPGCNCPMCQSIVAQIEAQRRLQQQQPSAAANQPRGHYERRKVCTNGYCRIENVWVQD